MPVQSAQLRFWSGQDIRGKLVNYHEPAGITDFIGRDSYELLLSLRAAGAPSILHPTNENPSPDTALLYFRGLAKGY
jgi:hypothetical protein